MNKLFWSLFLLSFLGSNTLRSQSWESLNTGSDYILFDISIPPGQVDVIYAAGLQYTYDAEGIIIKSIDGGDTWQQMVGGNGTVGFETICFTSTDVGYVAGWDGYFAKTTNGGATWSPMSVGFDNWFFMDIEFYNADHGVALSNLNSGSSAIYITSNAGASWELCSPLNFGVQDLCYANEYTLYAVGSNEGIARSMNGGYGWTQIYSGSNDRFFMGVDFVEQFGVIGGEDGKIFHTLDGGENWSTYATGYHNFQGVHVFNADSAYIGGTDEDVYKTIDEGENWTVEDNGIGSSHIYKVKFAYDGTGFLCGSQGMIKRKEASGVLLVDFEADKTLICNWEQVDFFDLSIGAIDSWEWYFEGGNPSNSTEQNPQVYFTSPGIYDVSLIVTSNGQQYELIKENYITSDFALLIKNRIRI